ncbi:hypothetical protein PFICI_03413 [Pestalotiopsis fici W106-1]|uniref:Uncharacterized protein n=1 Tax=Pestalotiopsis fici (strain W106-1 / CGMCC3.15140) TaxID=1229662 RepID=W3XH21_PESFW|nr:uncharacterized protein PFICI_03413 [Pestalotiopsis fici W106-1]ETS85388.1 hypothetical protein PFICI_03413 [Pestalotiopsis fici W106-1]
MTGFKYLNQAESFLKEPYQPSQTPTNTERNSGSSDPDNTTRAGGLYQQSNRSRPSFSLFRQSNESRSNISLYGHSNQSRPNLSFVSDHGHSPTTSVHSVDKSKTDKGKKRAGRHRSKTAGAEASPSSPVTSSPISPLGNESTVHQRAARATRERMRDVNNPIKVHSRLSAIMDKDLPSSGIATVSLRLSELPDNILISRPVREMARDSPDSVATFQVQFHPGLDVNLNNMAEAIFRGQAMPVAREISADMVAKVDKPLSPIAERSSSPIVEESPSSIIEKPTFPVGEILTSPSKRRRASTKSVHFSEEDKIFHITPAGSSASKDMLANSEGCAVASDDESKIQGKQDEDHDQGQQSDDGADEIQDQHEDHNRSNVQDNDEDKEDVDRTEDPGETSFSSESDSGDAQPESGEDTSHSFILPEFDFELSASRFSSIFADDGEAPEVPAVDESSGSISLSSPPEVLAAHEPDRESQSDSANNESIIIPTADQEKVETTDEVTEGIEIDAQKSDTVIVEQCYPDADEQGCHNADEQDVIGDNDLQDATAAEQSDDVSDKDNSVITADSQRTTTADGENTVSNDDNSTIIADEQSAIIADESNTVSNDQDSIIVNVSNTSVADEQTSIDTHIEARDNQTDQAERTESNDTNQQTEDYVDDDVEVSSIFSLLINKQRNEQVTDNGQSRQQEVMPRAESPTMGEIGEQHVMVTIPPLVPRPRPNVTSQRSHLPILPRYPPPTPAPSYPVPNLPKEVIPPMPLVPAVAPLRLHQRSEQDLRGSTRNLPVLPRASQIPAPGTSSGLPIPAPSTPRRPALRTAKSFQLQHEDSPRPVPSRSLIPELPARAPVVKLQSSTPDAPSRIPAIPPRMRPLRPSMSINDMATASNKQNQPSFAQRAEKASYNRPSADIPRPSQSRIEVIKETQVSEQKLSAEETVPLGPTISRHVPKPRQVLQPQPEQAEPSRLRKIATRSLGSLAGGSYRSSNRSFGNLKAAAAETSNHPLPYKKWLHSSEAATLQDDLSRGYDANSPYIRQRHQVPMPIPPAVNSRTSSIGATDAGPGYSAASTGLHSSRVPRRPQFGRSNIPPVANAASGPDQTRLSQVLETDETTPKRGPPTPQTISGHRYRRPATPQSPFVRDQHSPVTPQATAVSQQQNTPENNIQRQLYEMLDHEIERQRTRPVRQEEIASSPLSARTPEAPPRRSIAPTPPRRIPTVRRSTDTIRTATMALPCGHTEVQHRSLTDEDRRACGISGGRALERSSSDNFFRNQRPYDLALHRPRQFFAHAGLTARVSTPTSVSTQAFLFPEGAEAFNRTYDPERPGGRDLTSRMPRSATAPALLPCSPEAANRSEDQAEDRVEDRAEDWAKDRPDVPSPGTAAQRSFAKLCSRFTIAELRSAYGGETEEEIVRALRSDQSGGIKGGETAEQPHDPFVGVPEHSNILYSASAGGPRDLVAARDREQGGPYDEEVSQLEGVVAASTPRQEDKKLTLRSSKSVSSLLTRFRRGKGEKK